MAILTDVLKKLYENRIVRIDSDINDVIAGEVCSTLQALDDESHKPIWLYINSPGGSVSAGLEIIDTMNSLKSPVFTVNVALCASMGAMILSSGAKRHALPHARTMIHQVSSGTQGNIQDMRISYKETDRLNSLAMSMLAKNCNKSLDDVMEDTERDHWMYPEEAIKYGIIDEILGKDSRKLWTPRKEAA